MTLTTEAQLEAPPVRRLVSLDVLRGVTMMLMILVNSPGIYAHTYWPLKHVDWNGWTITDLVFPTFVFLMGTSIVFGTEARLRRGDSRSALLLHTLWRFGVLFLLGLVVNGFPFFHLGTLRIYGVLQRIAICYLVGSALYLWNRRAAMLAALAVVLLLGYWALLRWVPVPGFGLPGRDVPMMDMAGNYPAYVDRMLSPGRLYMKIRDPEGLLSNLPAIATMLLGMLTGLWLRTRQTKARKAAGMMIAGLLGLGAGELWNLWFPINKNLWTSSFVLFAAGWSLLAFAFCFWALEGRERSTRTPWWMVAPLAFGMNTITGFIFSELLASTLATLRFGHRRLQQIVFQDLFAWTQPQEVASLLYAIAFVVVCFVPVYVLYRKRIFIKI